MRHCPSPSCSDFTSLFQIPSPAKKEKQTRSKRNRCSQCVVCNQGWCPRSTRAQWKANAMHSGPPPHPPRGPPYSPYTCGNYSHNDKWAGRTVGGGVRKSCGTQNGFSHAAAPRHCWHLLHLPPPAPSLRLCFSVTPNSDASENWTIRELLSAHFGLHSLPISGPEDKNILSIRLTILANNHQEVP